VSKKVYFSLHLQYFNFIYGHQYSIGKLPIGSDQANRIRFLESTDFTVCDDIPVIGALKLSLNFCYKITGFPAHRFPTTSAPWFLKNFPLVRPRKCDRKMFLSQSFAKIMRTTNHEMKHQKTSKK